MKSEIDIQNLKKGIGRISETQGRRCLIEPIVCDIIRNYLPLPGNQALVKPLQSLCDKAFRTNQWRLEFPGLLP